MQRGLLGVCRAAVPELPGLQRTGLSFKGREPRRSGGNETGLQGSMGEASKGPKKRNVNDQLGKNWRQPGQTTGHSGVRVRTKRASGARETKERKGP